MIKTIEDIEKEFLAKGFFYSGGRGSMSKTGFHKLDKFIKNSYVKFYPTQTVIYTKINDLPEWKHLIFDQNYDLISEEIVNLLENQISVQ
jgi:hypothetical protein